MSSYHYKILMFAVMAAFVTSGHAQFDPPAAIDGHTDGDHIGMGLALMTTIVRAVVMGIASVGVLFTAWAGISKFKDAFQGKMGCSYADCGVPVGIGSALVIGTMFFYNWFDEKQLAQFSGA